MSTNYGKWRPIHDAPKWMTDLMTEGSRPQLGASCLRSYTDTNGDIWVLWYDQDRRRYTKCCRLSYPHEEDSDMPTVTDGLGIIAQIEELAKRVAKLEDYKDDVVEKHLRWVRTYPWETPDES